MKKMSGAILLAFTAIVMPACLFSSGDGQGDSNETTESASSDTSDDRPVTKEEVAIYTLDPISNFP